MYFGKYSRMLRCCLNERIDYTVIDTRDRLVGAAAELITRMKETATTEQKKAIEKFITKMVAEMINDGVEGFNGDAATYPPEFMAMHLAGAVRNVLASVRLSVVTKSIQSIEFCRTVYGTPVTAVQVIMLDVCQECGYAPNLRLRLFLDREVWRKDEWVVL